MGLSRTVSEINGDFDRKSQFFYLHVFDTPAEGLPLEFCDSYGTKNKDDAPTRCWEKSGDIYIRLDTISQYDG